jgi:hypothetical protein
VSHAFLIDDPGEEILSVMVETAITYLTNPLAERRGWLGTGQGLIRDALSHADAIFDLVA